jgi:hypothetical protein
MLNEGFVEMNFPLAGVDLENGFSDQKPRQVAEGTWSKSTPEGTNVVGCVPGTLRFRGGSRPGLSKYINASAVPTWVVQELNFITVTESQS